ncbi:hypothetical protein Hanom_Chr15g01353011 [Helianthus anomalus]
MLWGVVDHLLSNFLFHSVCYRIVVLRDREVVVGGGGGWKLVGLVAKRAIILMGLSDEILIGVKGLCFFKVTCGGGSG